MPQLETEGTKKLAYSEKDLDAAGLMSRKTRWRLRQDGRFPEPVQVGGRSLYRAADIREWLRDPEGWAEEHGGRGVSSGGAQRVGSQSAAEGLTSIGAGLAAVLARLEEMAEARGPAEVADAVEAAAELAEARSRLARELARLESAPPLRAVGGGRT